MGVLITLRADYSLIAKNKQAFLIFLIIHGEIFDISIMGYLQTEIFWQKSLIQKNKLMGIFDEFIN